MCGGGIEEAAHGICSDCWSNSNCTGEEGGGVGVKDHRISAEPHRSTVSKLRSPSGVFSAAEVESWHCSPVGSGKGNVSVSEEMLDMVSKVGADQAYPGGEEAVVLGMLSYQSVLVVLTVRVEVADCVCVSVSERERDGTGRKRKKAKSKVLGRTKRSCGAVKDLHRPTRSCM